MKKRMFVKVLSVALTTVLLAVGYPLSSSAYSQDVSEVKIYTDLEDYLYAGAEIIANHSGELVSQYTIDIKADVVSDELGNTVKYYDEAIDEALNCNSISSAQRFLEDNEFEVVERTGAGLSVVDDFQTMRLMVRAPHIHTTMGAQEAVYYDGEYLLQYASREDAITAYDYFSSQSECEVFTDSVVSVDATADNLADTGAMKNGIKDHYSWGVSVMGLDVMQDNLVAEDYELPEITVAVLDTGITRTNKYLEGRILDSGYNFLANTDDANDNNGHGTHVSGIVVDGTAENVKILPVKVMNEEGKGTLATINNGLRYAFNEGADVVNLSLSTVDNARTLNYLDSTIDSMVEHGVVICASAGNDTKDATNYYPARLDSVLTIAALVDEGVISYYSNYGPVIDFALPGSSIISTYQEALAYKSGTSMAAPHAAAAAALLKTWNPSLNQTQIKDILIDNCIDYGTKGFDTTFGYGMINLANFDTERNFDMHVHNYISTIIKQPTCIMDGLTLHECSICGDKYETRIVALEHDFKITHYEATCQSEGYDEYACNRCNARWEMNQTPKVGHKYDSAITKQPTYDTEGELTYTCTVCGDSYTQPIPKLEKPTETFILGDADGNGYVSVSDATIIQRFIAEIQTQTVNEMAADVDGNEQITVFDATYIQRYIANLYTPFNIGETISR